MTDKGYLVPDAETNNRTLNLELFFWILIDVLPTAAVGAVIVSGR